MALISFYPDANGQIECSSGVIITMWRNICMRRCVVFLIPTTIWDRNVKPDIIVRTIRLHPNPSQDLITKIFETTLPAELTVHKVCRYFKSSLEEQSLFRQIKFYNHLLQMVNIDVSLPLNTPVRKCITSTTFSVPRWLHYFQWLRMTFWSLMLILCTVLKQ